MTLFLIAVRFVLLAHLVAKSRENISVMDRDCSKHLMVSFMTECGFRMPWKVVAQPSTPGVNGMMECLAGGRREGRGTIYFTNGAVYEGRFRDDAVDGQGTMKMSRAMVIPREGNRKLTSDSMDLNESKQPQQQESPEQKPISESEPLKSVKQASKVEQGKATEDQGGDDSLLADPSKQDYMIPISFQSDMTHIHTKAGFTAIGH